MGRVFFFFFNTDYNSQIPQWISDEKVNNKKSTLNIICRNILTEKTDLSRIFLQSLKTFCVRLICNVA